MVTPRVPLIHQQLLLLLLLPLIEKLLHYRLLLPVLLLLTLCMLLQVKLLVVQSPQLSAGAAQLLRSDVIHAHTRANACQQWYALSSIPVLYSI
jgi:hypothetical protein